MRQEARRRVWRLVLLALGLSLVLGGAVLWFVLSTGAGARAVVGQLHRLPTPIRAEGVAGRLRGPLELTTVQVKLAGVSLEIDSILLDWRPFKLLGKRLEIDSLRAVGVRAAVTPSPRGEPDRAPPARQFRLPIDVGVGKASVEELEIVTPGGLEIREGRVQLSGTVEQYALEAEALALSPLTPEARLHLIGRGDLYRLRFEPLTVRLSEGEATAQGSIAWVPQIAWQFELTADSLALAPFLPDPTLWPGRVSLSGRSEGVLGAEPSLRAQLDTLYGTLRDQPIHGSAELAIDSSRHSLTRLDLLWGAASLQASGSIGDSLDLRLEADVPNLAAHLPHASGSAWIVANLRGPRDLLGVVAQVAASGIELSGARLDELEGQIQLDLADPGTALVNLHGSGLSVAGRTVERIALEGRGTRSPTDGAGVSIETLEARLLGGRLAARGWLSWQPRPRWRLAFRADDIMPASLFNRPEDWPGKLALRGSSEGSFEQMVPVGHLSLDTLTGSLRRQPVNAKASVRLGAEEYTLSALSLDWGPARLRASGAISDTLALAFDLEAPDLALVLPNGAGSARATGRVRGSRSAPEIQAGIALEGVRIGNYGIRDLTGDVNLGQVGATDSEITLQAAGVRVGKHEIEQLDVRGRGIRSEGSLSGIAIDSATSVWLEGRLSATGRVTWKPEVGWQLAISGDELAPAALFPDPTRWPGQFSFRASTEGALAESPPWAVRLSVDTLRGTLRDRPVSGRALAVLEPRSQALPELDLHWGGTRVHAAGTLSEQLDLEFHLEAPDLAAAIPGAAGSLSLKAHLGGTRTEPRLDANVTASAIDYRSYRIGGLQGQTAIDLGQPGEVELDLVAGDLAIAGRTADRITLRGRGTRLAHEFRASIEAADPTLNLTLSGGLTDGVWRGEIERLELQSPSSGDWRLRNTAKLDASPNALHLERLCLDATESAACAEGFWEREGGWRLSSSLRALPLAVVRPLLPDGWSLSGALDGEVDATMAANGRLRAELELQPGPGTIRYPLGDAAQTLSYDRGTLRFHAAEDGVRGNLDLTLHSRDARVGFVMANVELPRFRRAGEPLAEQPLSGRVEARLDDLTPLQALFSRVARTSGRLEVDINVNGTVAKPRLLGELRLRGGQADLPALGLRVREVELTASGDGRGALSFSGSARSGPGTLTVTGESPLVPTAEAPTRLQISGERFQVVNTPHVQVLVSPDLETRIAGERVALSGELRIPQASVELSELPQTAVPVSKDEVILGQEEPPLHRRTNVSGRVRLALGNDVSFKGLGFAARLTGSILAIEEPGKPTTGSGELLIVDGQYKAYGQTLEIDRGRVLFAGGPIDNPGLDARASRKAADGVVAGVFIRGTVKAPEITLFSEPPMTDSEALSYLILGRPLDEASQSETNVLSSAARSLGLKGGNLLARSIAAGFGLDEARLEGGRSLRDASFVAGKYLSPRIYVIYGIGLFDRASTFRVRYLLSSRWTLVGETGEATSTDILYRIERGR